MKVSNQWRAINDQQFWKALPKDYNKIPKSMKHEESFTMYIPKTLKERLTNPNGRRVLEVSRRLRFMIANSLQLSLHDYFEPLTKPKRKNKTRKEVL